MTSFQNQQLVSFIFQLEYLGFHHEDFSAIDAEPSEEIDKVLVAKFSGIGYSVMGSIAGAVRSLVDGGFNIPNPNYLCKSFSKIENYVEIENTQNCCCYHHSVIRVYGG